MTTAQQLINNVMLYKQSSASTKNMVNNKLPCYCVYLGQSNYPDQSNLSAQNIYPHISSVAFFSQKIKPDFFFVLALLLGNNDEAYNLMDIMFSNLNPPPVQWSDIVEYLAYVKGIYFVNVSDANFNLFANSFVPKSIKFLIFSKSNKTILNQVMSLSSYLDHAAIIHPSSRNINKNTMDWVKQYVTQTFTGQIPNSNLSYTDFMI